MLRFLIALCLVIGFGSAAGAARFTTGGWTLDPEAVFPDGAFDPDDPGLDWQLRTGPTAVMRAMREPALPRLAEEGALIRLTVIPWRGTPFTFRVSRSTGEFQLDFKIVRGAATNPLGLEFHDRFTMSAPEFLAALEPLAAIKVCANAPRAVVTEGDPIWILETLNGPYCLRTLAGPNELAFRDLLIALSSPLKGIPRVLRLEIDRLNRVGE